MADTVTVSVRVIPQRHTKDCLIACLAMLLQASYEATLLAISKITPDAGTSGLYWKDARKAAKALGFKVKVVRKQSDYTKLVGILDCFPMDASKPHHVVFLLRGTVIDPEEPAVWDNWQAYMEVNGYVGGSVLVKA